MTQRALWVIRPNALLSLGFVNLCWSANLQQKLTAGCYRVVEVEEGRYVAEKVTLLVEVSPIQPDDNVTVAQTAIICFKVADIFKFAFGHAAGTTGEKGQRFDSGTTDSSSKSAGLPNQHEGPEARRERKKEEKSGIHFGKVEYW